MNDVTPSRSGAEAASSFHSRLSPGDREKCRETLIAIIRQYTRSSALGAEMSSVGQGMHDRGLDYNYGITGCSILGDGNISIILDVRSLYHAASGN